MCGRASLTKQEKDLEKRFKASFYQEDIERYNPLPNFNVAPTHRHPVITSRDSSHLQYFRWGLIPHWSRDERTGYKMINARLETLTEKPSFRNLLDSHRCLVPFDGFYEWKQGEGKVKQPYHIRLRDRGVFCIAGLWTEWRDAKGELIPTFTLITLSPNHLMMQIHDRMPAILLPEQESLWLDDDLPLSDRLALLQPCPDHWLEAVPVSTRVNKVTENDANLLEAVGEALIV